MKINHELFESAVAYEINQSGLVAYCDQIEWTNGCLFVHGICQEDANDVLDLIQSFVTFGSEAKMSGPMVYEENGYKFNEFAFDI